MRKIIEPPIPSSGLENRRHVFFLQKRAEISRGRVTTCPARTGETWRGGRVFSLQSRRLARDERRRRRPFLPLQNGAVDVKAIHIEGGSLRNLKVSTSKSASVCVGALQNRTSAADRRATLSARMLPMAWTVGDVKIWRLM